MSFKKYIRRNIYKWHRITGLIIVLPVMLSTISGFLHPIMGSFKPEVKNNSLPAAILDTAKITMPLSEALRKNGIDSFRNFRIIKIQDEFYYQVQNKNADSLTYINCENGNMLPDGDKLYANYLAQRFLWEDNGNKKNGDHHNAAGDVSAIVVAKKENDDLPSACKILSTTLISEFSKEYKAANKILPVYEVRFDRSDNISLYIETRAGRLVVAVDNNKRWYSAFFSFAHSLSFLNGLGKTKSVLLGLFSLLCFLSSVLGFIVYNVLKQKTTTSTGKKWHGWLGNVFLATTLLYSFSGTWHAFAKVSGKPSARHATYGHVFSNHDINDTYLSLIASSEKQQVHNLSIVKIGLENYWQLFCSKGKQTNKQYVHITSAKLVQNGDVQYAKELAKQIKRDDVLIKHAQPLTSFNHQYSMMNKRLPVVEVAFSDQEKYYIETATGSLAAVTGPGDAAERFSFRNLHMHHYWEMWLGKNAGKTARNTVLISSTAGLVLLALTGTLIYIRKRKKKK